MQRSGKRKFGTVVDCPTTSAAVDNSVDANSSVNKLTSTAISSSSTTGGNPFFNRNILYQYIEHPENFENEVIYHDTDFTVIKDRYPKSKIHLLLLAHPHKLQAVEVRKIKTSDLNTINEYIDICNNIIDDIVNPITDLKKVLTAENITKLGLEPQLHASLTKESFMVGIHAIPSLRPLHIHIISTDFVSAHLKTKYHYLSFATKFLIPLTYVQKVLESGRDMQDDLEDETYFKDITKQELQCYHCHMIAGNMPQLKEHLLSHVCQNNDA